MIRIKCGVYMLNIIIFGTGKLAEVVEACLKHNLANVIYYSDNDSSKWGSIFKGKPIIEPTKLNNTEYDYIIIASQYNEEIYSQLIKMGISNEKIFEFGVFFKNGGEVYPKDRIEKYINSHNDYECIITGISYSLVGIDIDSFKYKAYTFANGSQDLYYDYKIARYAINNGGDNIKYCIIGLCYYSFQYDLSLSNMKFRVNGYYDFFNDSHNAHSIKENRDDINKKIGNLLISFGNGEQVAYQKPMTAFEDSMNKVEMGKRIATNDCNKNYPKTVEENKKIFKEYIEFLIKKNIEPIVVVFPASKYYIEFFSSRIKEEFSEIINEFQKEYNFKYLDFFENNLFEDRDFCDVSHLNKDGARKFTKLLNELI